MLVSTACRGAGLAQFAIGSTLTVHVPLLTGSENVPPGSVTVLTDGSPSAVATTTAPASADLPSGWVTTPVSAVTAWAASAVGSPAKYEPGPWIVALTRLPAGSTIESSADVEPSEPIE